MNTIRVVLNNLQFHTTHKYIEWMVIKYPIVSGVFVWNGVGDYIASETIRIRP